MWVCVCVLCVLCVGGSGKGLPWPWLQLVHCVGVPVVHGWLTGACVLLCMQRYVDYFSKGLATEYGRDGIFVQVRFMLSFGSFRLFRCRLGNSGFSFLLTQLLLLSLGRVNLCGGCVCSL